MPSYIKEKVEEILNTQTEIKVAQGRIEQKVDDLNERLFNGGTGAIPVAFRNIKEVREAAQGATAAAAAVSKRVDHINWYAAGVAGTLTVLFAMFSKLGHKLGWW